MSFIVVIENALKLSKTFIIMGERRKQKGNEGFPSKILLPILFDEFFAFLHS